MLTNHPAQNLRPAPGLRLRKVGSKSMIVKITSDNVDFSEVFTLNDIAARIWQLMEVSEGPSPQSIAQAIADEYEVGFPEALADVQEQLRQWKEFGLIL